MPVQAIVRNYLAVEEAKLLIRGLTILRGESFQGKSSLVAGLRAAFTNVFTSTCVRWGSDAAEIKVKFPDGQILCVRRTAKGATEMEFAGQTYTKLGRAVPEAISDYLNLRQVSLGADTYNLNFYDQFQPPLLLACSHKRLADMLSASGALADFNLLQKALASRKDELKGSFTTLDGLLTTAKAMAGADRTWLDKAEPIADALRREHATLVQLEKQQVAAEKLAEDTGNSSILVDRTHRTANILDAISEYEASAAQLERVELLQRGLRVHQNRSRVMSMRAIAAESLKSLESQLETLHSLQRLMLDMSAIDALTTRTTTARRQLAIYGDALSASEVLDALVSQSHCIISLAADIKIRSLLTEAITKNRNLLEQDSCPFCGAKVTDKDTMNREDIQRRRDALEEQLRKDEQDMAVLDARIKETATSLGLTDPTPEQVENLRADIAQKVAKQERVVESQLAKLDELTNPTHV